MNNEALRQARGDNHGKGAVIIDGKALAERWLGEIAEEVHALHAPVHLAAVCAGDDAGTRAFVKLKQKAAQSVGITFSSYMFDGNNEQEVIDTLRYLAADDSVHGIFTELPLPEGWSVEELIAQVPPKKDVDALVPGSFVLAPSVCALEYVLCEHGIVTAGMKAAVIGHGRLVGQPVARWLQEYGAHVDVIDEHTADPERHTRSADLIVIGVGKPGLVTGEWVKEGATVIDFGYAKKGDRFTGDVDADSVKKKAGLLTPVPGGMGPLVVAAVLENLVTLATHG